MTGSWQFKALGDVCTVIGGGTPSKSNEEYYGGKIPWATVRDMRTDVLLETEHKITDEAVINSSTNIIPANNVVIATRVGLGKICFIGRDTAINQDLRGVIPKNAQQLSKFFLFWWFKSVAHSIVAAGTGATVQGVKLPFIKSLQVPMPALPEQKRIVAILDKVFAGIATATANAEKNLHNARELFESYLSAIFTEKGNGWVTTKLGELCSFKHGFAFKSEFFAPVGDYILLTPGNFYESGGYRDRGEKQKYYVGVIPMDFVLKKGDFLVAMTEQAAGLLGSSIIVPESNRFLHNQRLGLAQVHKRTKWVNEFFFHHFNTRNFRKAVHTSASGIKVRHTSPKKLEEIDVCYPHSRDSQIAIAKKLDDLRTQTISLKAIYQQKLADLAELKQSILQKAFSGKLH